MAHYVLSEVTARHVPSRCPLCMMDKDSEVASELHEGEAKSVLTEEQIRRYDAASLANAVEQSTSFHSCKRGEEAASSKREGRQRRPRRALRALRSTSISLPRAHIRPAPIAPTCWALPS